MGYYNKKKKAFQLIDELLKDGKDINLIYYKISTKFGFGEKIVNERIEQIKKLRELKNE